MITQPTLDTGRLRLRPFTLADAPAVQRLAGDWAIANTTLNVPHPYEDGMAEQWIGTHQTQFEQRQAAVFAIVLRASDELVGAISLGINQQYERAEMGYWIGKPYWNQGYATEAARALGALRRPEILCHSKRRLPGPVVTALLKLPAFEDSRINAWNNVPVTRSLL